jgi:hypothetical protein
VDLAKQSSEDGEVCVRYLFILNVAEPKPHHFGGAGAVTRCGSGFNLNDELRWIKYVTNCHSFYFSRSHYIYNHFNCPKFSSEDKVAQTLRLTFVCFKKVGLLYRRVGAGTGAGSASKFLPGSGAA